MKIKNIMLMAAVATAALTGCGIVMYLDSENFSQMRICHMYAAADEISFGIYACSPEESSFTAVFSDMKITECAWKAHDGQQPDNI